MGRVGWVGGCFGIKGVGHTGKGYSFSGKMGKVASLVFPSQLIQLSKAKLNKAANCPAQKHRDITTCFQEEFLNFSGNVKVNCHLWREAAPHTILIFWGQRAPYPASSYTAIVNILLDRWEVPLTPLTVTVHGDLYRRHQSQCYGQRSRPSAQHKLCPTPSPIHSSWDSGWGCSEMWVHKATRFSLESLGVKQQCWHCCRGRSDWV